MRSYSLQSSPRSITCTTANLIDIDSIKTAIATVAAITTYTGAQLNGADVGGDFIARPTPDGHTGCAQYPIVTGAANAGSYVNLSTVVFTGTYGGVPATSTATVVGTDGGTFIADNPLDTVSSVTIGAQVNAGGSWQLGFTDLACRNLYGNAHPFRALRVNAAGNVDVVYDGGFGDLIPFLAGEIQHIEPFRVRQATTTAASFTIYE